jgi:3-isopropylmalate/(R)-2-methylmalate dehydratase small subunit
VGLIAMEPVSTVSGPVSTLLRNDVDTDQMIPKQFLKRIERTGWGQFLFHDWSQDPGWDLPQRPILVAGRNFGCGSSREHAPWALHDYGFRAIIAPSFADIFRSNCTKIGLLPIVLPEEQVRAVAAAGEAEIDLRAQEVRSGGETYRFEIDQAVRERLLDGVDEIALTLRHTAAIEAHERAREGRIPVTTAL